MVELYECAEIFYQLLYPNSQCNLKDSVTGTHELGNCDSTQAQSVRLATYCTLL